MIVVKRQPGNQAKETHLLELAVTMRCLDTAPQPESWQTIIVPGCLFTFKDNKTSRENKSIFEARELGECGGVPNPGKRNSPT
jgi:hypothetical protein